MCPGKEQIGVCKKFQEETENVFRREESPSIHIQQPNYQLCQEREAALSCGN